MCVDGSQAVVQLRGALKRGFLAKRGHLKRLRPPATACDRLRPWAPPLLPYMPFTQDDYPEGANNLPNSRICTFEPTMVDFIDVVVLSCDLALMKFFPRARLGLPSNKL